MAFKIKTLPLILEDREYSDLTSLSSFAKISQKKLKTFSNTLKT